MRELRWKHHGWFARSFDLLEDDRVLATLAQRGWSGMNGELRIGARAYRVETTGLFRWSIRIADEHGTTLASMRVGWRGNGAPQLADGRAFSWDVDNWWGTRWRLDAKGSGRIALVHMDRFLRMDARMEVEPHGLRDEDLLPILALTWFSVVLTTQAAASAGAG